MQRYYGIDLAEFWRGGISPRRLFVLVSQLPPDSATWAVQSDVPFGWTIQTQMLADIFHALTGEPHPASPSIKKKPSKDAAALAARLKAQRERLAAQRVNAPTPD